MNLYFRLLRLRLTARRRGRLSLWDTARTPFRVALTDLDLMRHMNNGKYLSILDLGRMDLMIRSGSWAKFMAQGWYPVVASQTVTYRRSLRLGQRFDVLTRVIGADDRSVYLEQSFVVGSAVYARAVIRSRFLKRSGGTVERPELDEVAGAFPPELILPAWVHDWADATRITEPA